MKSIHTLDQYTTVVSELTGRTVYVNDALDKYLVSPDWNRESCLAVCTKLLSKIEQLRVTRRPPPSLRAAIRILGESQTRPDFGLSLDNLLVNEFQEKLETTSIVGAQRFLVELVLDCWSSGLLAWPAKEQVPFSNPSLKLEAFKSEAPQLTLLVPIRAYLSRGGTDDSGNFRFILDHLLARAGVVEIGDLTPKTFYLERGNTRLGKMRSPGMKAVLHALRETHHNQAIEWKPEDFGFFKDKMGSLARDEDYVWVISKDPEMKEWVSLAKEHLATNPANFKRRRSTMHVLLKHFLDNPSIPRNPVEYFDIKKRPSVVFDVPTEKGRQSMQVAHEFMNEALFKTCAQPNDNEIPILMPGFASPLSKTMYRNVNQGETHREAMPSRLISQAMHILTENDFAWARKVGYVKDVFRWQNPETGEYESVWSPVRAYALLIKLLLPARTYQVRHLDSGEGDTFRYESSGVWVKNVGPNKPVEGVAPVENGIFRKYKRKDGTFGAVFFFNTNKTADIDSISKGYVMPWEKIDALKLFAELRNWQEKYNPVKGPTSWSDIPELKKDKHADDLLKMGENHFLFRDPANDTRPDVPVTDIRVRNLWLKLMEELENRLASSGETLLDETPIKLVLTRDKSGQASSVAFDLHSLRVTIITALYEEGVPPEYLMKIVGHATVLMTLYYTKIRAETLSLRMDDAMLERQRKSQTEMAGFIKKASRKELEQAVAYRHESALDAVAGGTGVGLLVMDHGICATAGKRCHEGLAVIDMASGATKFQPVPGGATNCARCRFFMTGPAFLFGMEAHVNDLSYRLKATSLSFEKAQSKFDTISDEYATALETCQPFIKLRELEIAETMFEAATAEVDGVALSLQAAYALTEQCIRISKTHTESDSSFSLVAAGGVGEVEAVLSENHEFEQLHRLCQSATFFDGLKINWQQPNLERARLFDRMLRNSGHEPRMMLLDDETTLRVANSMGNFLYARLDANSVHALIDGRTTLRAVGLEKAFISQLEQLEPKQLSATTLRVLENS